VSALRIRLNDQDQAVTCFEHTDNDTWNLWVHHWTPRKSGTWTFNCYVDEDVRQVRLDTDFYERSITIDEKAG